ncbi:MAG TPA: nitroreductase [Streptosporangiaceae bacterium]|jgi:nitroreductase|nr:nitroreductase [Streptosporangiaceae bacterium]
MDAITAIHTRRSYPVLAEPAPTGDDLRTILSAAAAAPDHGRHRPWRFVVITGSGRDAFGDVLADAYRRSCAERGQQPDPTAEQRERAKPMRAPVIIAVACAAGADEKVPRQERLAATAAATQNLLVAATALGYGAMWRTGAAARDQHVKTALGFTDGDDITGFVYLGTIPADQKPSPARRELDGLARTWP